ncbi:Metallo-dependent phosphatase [Dendrothele bispora CBS 962.96]|uniref:Metallo-dependent phosphatase n=1 Tax=Dendrothele bispora (strain CBS 962.96) TaxID=1314807 RepID=A0A4S8L801_DENBC|nr:Metallo-dependent phosphatase [Dendrothele bispora CBS 962.96]
MILFENEGANDPVQEELGVTVQKCNSKTALDWETYCAGIEKWRQFSQSLTGSGSTVLGIAHFNDVYQVSDQKISVGGQQETIDVTKFATLLDNVTSKWKDRNDGKKDGLIIFSGDLFSPSTESSVTRGRHMPAIINALGVDVGVVGFAASRLGFDHFFNINNIVDTNTGKVPVPMKDIYILERAGIRIGFIGLVEEQWIATITGWPDNFKYQDMAEVGKKLSAKLRDPAGEYKCDLIIALTHSRALGALSPSAQKTKDISSGHGVDLLLGGHDHVYWISKGVSEWDGYDLQTKQPDAADDKGDVLVVKSGTDFQDLSEVVLTLKDTPAGSIRKKVISDIKGKRCVTRGNTEVNQDVKAVVDQELGTINAAMVEPICVTEVELDVKSSYIRRQESPIGNWVADSLRHAYDQALAKLGYQTTDGVIICNGDLRGDRVYPPGPITMGDLMTVLPFLDPVVVIEVSANTLWDAMESGLSRWPVQEGRFPAISGFRVTWDSSKPAGQRVLGIWLLDESKEVGKDGKPILVDKEEVLRSSSRKYLIMAGEYMVQGGDGYDALKGQKFILTAENGQSKSALIRKFLLGAQFVNKMIQKEPETQKASLNPMSLDILSATQKQLALPKYQLSLPDIDLPKLSRPPSFNIPGFASRAINQFDSRVHAPVHDYVRSVAQQAADYVAPIAKWLPTQELVTAALKLAEHEDMGLLDSYERQRTRMTARLLRTDTIPRNVAMRMISPMRFSAANSDAHASADDEEAKANAADEDAKKTLAIIHPAVDGRLKDVAINKAN